jgi:hypothetical protein
MQRQSRDVGLRELMAAVITRAIKPRIPPGNAYNGAPEGKRRKALNEQKSKLGHLQIRQLAIFPKVTAPDFPPVSAGPPSVPGRG